MDHTGLNRTSINQPHVCFRVVCWCNYYYYYVASIIRLQHYTDHTHTHAMKQCGDGANARVTLDKAVWVAAQRGLPTKLAELLKAVAKTSECLRCKRCHHLPRCSPLAIAALNNHCSCVALLIAANAEVNVTGNAYFFWQQAPPLHYAVASRHLGAVAMLLTSKADIHSTCYTRGAWYGDKALDLAASLENAPAVRALLEAKATLDHAHVRRATALDMSAYLGNATIAGLLLDANASCNRRGLDGRTPLHHALRFEHTKGEGGKLVSELLLHAKADAEARDAFGNTPLEYASLLGMYKVA